MDSCNAWLMSRGQMDTPYTHTHTQNTPGTLVWRSAVWEAPQGQCDRFMAASSANIPNPRPRTPWRQQSSGFQSRQTFDLITWVLIYTSTKAHDQKGFEVQDLLHTQSKQHINFLHFISRNQMNVNKKHHNIIIFFGHEPWHTIVQHQLYTNIEIIQYPGVYIINIY